MLLKEIKKHLLLQWFAVLGQHHIEFRSNTIPGNKEIADKMEACSRISKTDYPICSKSNEAIEKESINVAEPEYSNSGNVIATINLDLVVITTILASFHA